MAIITLACNQAVVTRGKHGQKPIPGKRLKSGKLSAATENDGKTFIYVMNLPDSHGCKIGTSRNPKSRRRQMQVGQAEVLRIFWVFQLEYKAAKTLERKIHRLLRGTDNHLRGEWYLMAPQTAVDVVKLMIERP